MAEQQIDINKVLGKLSAQISDLSVQKAVLEAQVEYLMTQVPKEALVPDEVLSPNSEHIRADVVSAD